MEYLQCGFLGLNQHCLCCPLLCAMLWRALSWKQPGGQLLCWPHPICFFFMAHMPGTPPEPLHSCAHSCCNLLVLYQDKSGKAHLPGVWGQTELQQGLKATGSKLVLALMFSSVVLIFLILFLLVGKGMHLFSSPSSLKSRQKVYGNIL